MFDVFLLTKIIKSELNNFDLIAIVIEVGTKRNDISLCRDSEEESEVLATETCLEVNVNDNDDHCLYLDPFSQFTSCAMCDTLIQSSRQIFQFPYWCLFSDLHIWVLTRLQCSG